MIIALLLAAAAPETAVDAERAFAAMAQTDGQWTAFRAFATEDATMFAPLPVNAQEFLKPLKDPPRAIEWSPTASFVSCDGKFAVNTGEWRQPDGSVGFFSTVWSRQSDGSWKWIVDGGDALATPRKRVARPLVRRASCSGAGKAPVTSSPGGPDRTGGGESSDGTLRWQWTVAPGGARVFEAEQWDGRVYAGVIRDQIAAPEPAPKP